MIPVIVALLFGVSAFLVAWFFGYAAMEKKIMDQRAASLTKPVSREKASEGEETVNLGIRAFEQRRLWRKAGFKAPLPKETVVFLTIAFLAIAFLVFKYAQFTLVMKAAVLALTGMILLRLARVISQRRRTTLIRRELPAALDIIVVCLEAGLGLEASFLRVSNEMRGTPLGGELKQTFHEVSAGVPMGDALRNLAHRAQVTEINTIVIAIIQAQKMGTSLAGTFRVQADSLREKYRLSMREKMAKVPILILLPLVFFIFPALFVVILGPAAASIFKELVNPGP